jgi:hypothetical protein
VEAAIGGCDSLACSWLEATEATEDGGEDDVTNETFEPPAAGVVAVCVVAKVRPQVKIPTLFCKQKIPNIKKIKINCCFFKIKINKNHS